MPATFRQFEAFHAVVATGGVTRAASLLGLSQPAVSRLIAELEADVGFALFLRSARTMRPTDKARELYLEDERCFLGMAHIEETIRRLGATSCGTLRLAIVPSLATQITHDLIGPFARLHPDIRVSIEISTTLSTVEHLDTTRSDIGITNDLLQAGHLTAHTIGETTAVCVMPATHRLAKLSRALTPRDFQGETFVSFMPVAIFRKRLDRLFVEAKVERDLRYEARTTSAVCELATAVAAVTLVPAMATGDARDRGFVVRRFVPALTSEIFLLHAADKSFPAGTDTFITFAKERMSATAQRTRTPLDANVRKAIRRA